MDRHQGAAEVQAIAKVNALRPTEADVRHLPGYERAEFSDEQCRAAGKEPGYYQWRVRFQPNEQGKKTRAMNETEEMLRPSIAADAERLASKPAPAVEAMRDQEGRTQFVPPHLAEQAAKVNGWRHRPYYGRGTRHMIARDGLIFRRGADGWNVEGEARSGLVHAPDGRSWRCLDGQWRRVA